MSAPGATAEIPRAGATPGRVEVLEQLDRILQSSAFSRSQRYSAFLRYCVEETLEGRQGQLKERTIGVDVFGRPLDWDASSDHAVRSAASEVRKRLATYYQQFADPGELRVELPVGSYVPGFVTESAVVAIEPVQESVATSPKNWRPLLSRRSMLVGGAAAASAVGAFAVYRARRNSGLEAFWKPTLSSPGEVIICLGSRERRPDGTTGVPQAQAQPSADPNVARFNRAGEFTFSSTMAVVRISNLLQDREKPFRVLPSSETTFSDLRGGPSVLIGAYNNPWTLRLMESLRYQFSSGVPLHPTILDSKDPQKDAWSRGATNRGRDYALISRVRQQHTEQMMVMLGGLGALGTSVAAEFLTSGEQFSKFVRHAPSDWAEKNVQIVLSTDIVDGVPSPPKIEATVCWA